MVYTIRIIAPLRAIVFLKSLGKSLKARKTTLIDIYQLLSVVYHFYGA